jgi:hypothetical protein
VVGAIAVSDRARARAVLSAGVLVPDKGQGGAVAGCSACATLDCRWDKPEHVLVELGDMDVKIMRDVGWCSAFGSYGLEDLCKYL